LIGVAGQSAVHAFDRIVRGETPQIGYWFDNSDLTIAETVDRILENLPHASV
jgi:hypothetical protein